MTRLFTFGCSYTSYAWPSWADLMSLDYDEVYNWALPGIGNRAIAERVAEAHAKHQFTKDDVIVVQWSTHLRNDWWHQDSLPERKLGWKTYGSIFNYHNKSLYDKKWINTFFYEPAFLMHSFNNIMLVQATLESIGCKWFMTSIGDIRNMGSDLRVDSNHGELSDSVHNHANNSNQVAWDLIPELKVYNDAIWKKYSYNWLMPLDVFCQSCKELTYDFIDNTGITYFEFHPSVDQHLKWLKEELSVKLPISTHVITISTTIAEQVKTLHSKFKYNKDAMATAIATTHKFPPEFASKVRWPSKPLGF